MRNVVCATDGFTVSNEKQNAAATHNLLGLIAWFIGYLHRNITRKATNASSATSQ